VTAPFAAEADPTESVSLASNIASMEQSRVVDEQATDLAPFGLATPRIKVAFKAEGGVSGEVHLGDKTPTQGDIYAVKPGTTTVFLVSSYVETTFDKQPFALRDKRVVKFERDKVDRIEIARGPNTLRMVRAGSDWTIEAPATGRADYASVEGLIGRLATAGMSAIVEDTMSDPTKYGLANPEMRFTLGAESNQASLLVGDTDPENARRYARDAARPMVFTLDNTLNDDLAKAFDQYYKRELFESRAFSTDRVRITRAGDGGARTWEFVKSTGEAGDTWTVAPEGGQSTAADRDTVEALLTKLASFQHGDYVQPSARTGLNAPLLTVSVSYGGGKFERVRVGLAGGQHYANREGEQLTGELAADLVTEALTALDAAVAPPAAATDTTAKP
jgi:hypothetical protein